jgi:hypothetical protein
MLNTPALLGPVRDAVGPHDFGKAGGRMNAVGLARAARPGQVGGQVPGGARPEHAGRVRRGLRIRADIASSHTLPSTSRRYSPAYRRSRPGPTDYR